MMFIYLFIHLFIYRIIVCPPSLCVHWSLHWSNDQLGKPWKSVNFDNQGIWAHHFPILSHSRQCLFHLWRWRVLKKSFEFLVVDFFYLLNLRINKNPTSRVRTRMGKFQFFEGLPYSAQRCGGGMCLALAQSHEEWIIRCWPHLHNWGGRVKRRVEFRNLYIL